MRRAAWMVALVLGLGPFSPAGAARAAGIMGYTVTDLGRQSDPSFTEEPRIDQSGHLVPSTVGYGDYRGGAVLDPDHYGRVLYYTLTRAGDPTNLLPAELGQPGTLFRSPPNISGDVVGLGGSGDANHSSFFYSPGSGQTTWLKALAGAGSYPQVFALNDLGQMVGFQDSQAIYYASPTADPVTLADLVGPNTGWQFFQATGINNLGQIVGYGINPSGQSTDFLLTPTSVPEPSSLVLVALATLAIVARHRLRRV